MKVGDIEYNRTASLELREIVIELRDAALIDGHMEWAVYLSHVVAWMAVAIDERWPK